VTAAPRLTVDEDVIERIATAVADKLEQRAIARKRAVTDAANEAPLSREAADRVDRVVLDKIRLRRARSGRAPR
jgi:hypothetical protein